MTSTATSTPISRASHRRQAQLTLWSAAALTLLLYFLPWFIPGAGLLALPLMWLSTLCHELGHGLMALALGGQFESLALHINGSGVAYHRGAFGDVERALIAAAGPMGPPLTALGLFAAARRPGSAHRALWLLGGLFALALLLWVRNLFGLLFVGALSVAVLLLAWRGGAWLAQIAAAFIALQMSLSSFSSADYLFSAGAATSSGSLPSDTTQIAMALGLTYWIWGALLALVSLAVLWLGIKIFVAAARDEG